MVHICPIVLTAALASVVSVSAVDAGYQSVLVGFSSEDGLGQVTSHAACSSGDGLGGLNVSSTPSNIKVHYFANALGGSSRRRKLSNQDPTVGYVRIDYTDAAGDPFCETFTDMKSEIAALSLLEGVTIVEENSEVQALGGALRGTHQEAIRRSLSESQPWGIKMVNVTQLWPLNPQGTVKICIIDTGYDEGHEDLPTVADHGVTGFTPSGGGSGYGVWNNDGNGHGTHVAGTVGAIGNNNEGVIGVNPDPSKYTFHIGKGLGDDGFGSWDGIIDSVEDCAAKGSDVISMSLGGGFASDLFDLACQEAYDQGSLVIAAAGNSGGGDYLYPASYKVVMSVGSVAEGGGEGSSTYGTLSSFSTHNDQVEISAPGSDVLSTTPNDSYDSYSGTSMATPHVAGVAALLMSHFPDCTNNQIRNAMLNSVREPPANDSKNVDGWDKYYGFGIVDAGAAYALLSKGCEEAGGKFPASGQSLSDMALGGFEQKNIGCINDQQCFIGPSYGERKCNLDTNVCYTVPGTAPTPPPTNAPTVFAPCVGDDVHLKVELKTDIYPEETSWTLTETCPGGQQIGQGSGYTAGSTLFTANYCVQDSRYEFTIEDTYGDGLFDPGFYKVYKDDTVMIDGGEFTFTRTDSFGSCDGSPPPNTTPPPVSSPPNSPPPVTSPPNTTPPVTSPPNTTPPPVSSPPNTTPPPVSSPPNTPPPVSSPPSTAILTPIPTDSDSPVFFPTPSCEKQALEVKVTTDNYPGETTWTLSNICPGEGYEIASGGPYSDALTLYSTYYCVPDGEFQFEIKDAWGDGNCCSYGQGGYVVLKNGVEEASGGNFGSSETKVIQGSCGNTSTSPTSVPTKFPITTNPTQRPITVSPTLVPTTDPTALPTNSPIANPTSEPTAGPTIASTTSSPTQTPTNNPTMQPTNVPTTETTNNPTNISSEVTIRVEIMTDEYPSETLWTLADACPGGGLVTSGGGYTEKEKLESTNTVTRSSRFQFSILDTFGDGLCCSHGSGSYKVYMDNDLQISGGEFGESEAFFFGDCGGGPGTPKPTPNLENIPSPTTSSPTASPPTPLSTTSPTLTGTNLAVYDPALGAPKCGSVHSSGRCTTLGTKMLNGKMNSVEQNPPNSLDACSDGPGGSYGLDPLTGEDNGNGDESIEAITVSAADGGVLTAGGLARITAHVYSWGNGNTDRADFYYAVDPQNPVWEHISTRRAGSGGITDIESETFVLPSSGLQAVRVNFRFYGQRSSCSGGSYDDVDDLVFAVETTSPEALALSLPAGLPKAKPSVENDVEEQRVDCPELPLDRCKAARDVCAWRKQKSSGNIFGNSSSERVWGIQKMEGCFPLK